MTAGGMGDRVLLGSRKDGLTGQELRDRAAATGAFFTANGAEKILFVGGNGPTFAISLFGAAAAHKPFLPLNYRLSDEQLGEILTRHTGLLIAEDVERARDLAPDATEVISVDDIFAIAPDPEASLIPADTEDIAVLLMTSGTTAAPKSAVLRHHHLTSYVMQTVEYAGADEIDATIVSVPPYHIAAVANLLSNLYAGRRIVYLDKFTAEEWIDVVTDEAITNAMVVPTMLSRIVRYLDESGRTGPATLRGLSYGGAKVPPTVLEDALRLFPETGFVNAYGLTETSSSIAVLGPDDHRAALASADPKERARIGSVGQVLPGVEVSIRNEVGDVVAANEPGEIYVRGAQVAGEYLEQGSKLVGEGWFPTRDRGWLDDGEFLFVEGRADDTIIRGGENIAPAEIEDVLVRHDAVLEVCIAGVPDEEWGNAIAAFVVVKDGMTCTVGEIKGFAREHLRSSKTPDHVYFLSELPATQTGKILRKDLIASVT
ncbi:class I adenylate-forming enzyme family protein [Nocardioides sp. P5_C9_2]